MASGIAQWTELASTKFSSRDLDATLQTIGTTPTLFSLRVNNSANSAACYVKFFNAASPSVGTTEADEIVMVPALTDFVYHFNGGLGLAFSTACKVACVAGPEPTNSTGPTNDVMCEIRHNGS